MAPAPVRLERGRLAEVLRPDGLTLLSGCAAESTLFAEELAAADDRLGAMTFCATLVAGFNRRHWLVNDDAHMLTFFMTPQLREVRDRTTFLPLCYQDALAELRRRKPQAALISVAPPDADGNCSFGVQADFLPELWRDIPTLIAHINPAMPATRGESIPFDRFTAFYEESEPLGTVAPAAPDAMAQAIARHVAGFVTDGSTLQLGLGKIPSAICHALSDRRHLRLHTGVIDDSLLTLADAGALADAPPSIVGLAIGSARLYERIADLPVIFRPVGITHGTEQLGAIRNLVSINSAIEVDLFGQAYAELQQGMLMSGPGGASDFARGVRMAGGIRIIALPATAAQGAVSRIVGPEDAHGPVSLGRMDIDVIVTEHGAADLRGCTHDERARRLIAIADPAHRTTLNESWGNYARRL